MSYEEYEWITSENAYEMYCINPKCHSYHEVQLVYTTYDSSTGITDYVGDGPVCDQCSSDLRDDPIEPYEILSEDFAAFVYSAIDANDWSSKEYQIYEQILQLLEIKNK